MERSVPQQKKQAPYRSKHYALFGASKERLRDRRGLGRTLPSKWSEACLNKKTDRMVCFFVEVPGFEPGLGEPKSHVLPLHHTSIAAAKLKTVLLFGNTVDLPVYLFDLK